VKTSAPVAPDTIGAGTSEKARLVTNTAANTVAQVVQVAAAFVFMPFLVQDFGLSAYGVLLLAGSLSGYLGLLDLGVGSAVVKLTAELQARQECPRLGRILGGALFFYWCVGLVIAVALASVAAWGMGVFELSGEEQRLGSELLLVGAVTALLWWPLNLGMYVLAGFRRYDKSAAVTVGAVAATALVTIVVLVWDLGPLLYLCGTGLVSVLSALVACLLAIGLAGREGVRVRRPDRRSLREVFHFSLTIFVMQVCAVLVYQHTDRLVLGVFVGATAIAFYEAASKLQSGVRQVAQLVASAAMPTASRLEAEGRAAALSELLLRGTKYCNAVVLPLTVSVIVLAEPLLRLWLGEDYAAHAILVQVFVSYWFVNSNTTVSGAVLIGTNRLRFLLWYSVVGAVANVLLSLALVQSLGSLGVILGTVIIYFAGFPIYMTMMFTALGMQGREWVKRCVLTTYPLVAIPLGLCLAGLHSGVCQTWYGLASVLAASLGSYWLCFAFFGMDRAERRELRGLARGAVALPGGAAGAPDSD